MRKIPSRFTDELMQQMIQQYEDGNSRLRIAKMFGTKCEVVTSVLKHHNIQIREQNPRKLTATDELEVVRLYRLKQSSSVIEKQFNICNQTLLKIVKKHGVNTRHRGQRFTFFEEHELEDIRTLWESGWSQTKIGNKYGVSQAVISRILRQNNFSNGKAVAKGSRHGNWKGGKTIHQGYVQVLVRPDDKYSDMANRMGYVMEHRLVMAQFLGRSLNAEETVHHINGDKKDNRLENLQLRQGKHGKGASFRCCDCGSRNVEAIAIGTED